MQSKGHSALEALMNVVVGYWVAVAANMLVLPAFGYAVSISDSLGIGLAFTAVSFVRGYVLRRMFNCINTGVKK